jgi:AcrR family transcriptional regulator
MGYDQIMTTSTDADAGEEAKRRRLTRDDWIEAATKRLILRSIDAVRVESLAAELKVSRGSFYWHFKSRGELLDAILAHWRERQTRRINERIREDRTLTPEERVVRLRSLPARTKSTGDAASLELAIRAWARRDRNARRCVEEVDRDRIAIVQELLSDVDLPAQEAETLAFVSYAYTIGESLIRDLMSDQQIAKCRVRVLSYQLSGMTESKQASLTKELAKSFAKDGKRKSRAGVKQR